MFILKVQIFKLLYLISVKYPVGSSGEYGQLTFKIIVSISQVEQIICIKFFMKMLHIWDNVYCWDWLLPAIWNKSLLSKLSHFLLLWGLKLRKMCCGYQIEVKPKRFLQKSAQHWDPKLSINICSKIRITFLSLWMSLFQIQASLGGDALQPSVMENESQKALSSGMGKQRIRPGPCEVDAWEIKNWLLILELGG